MFTAIAFAQSRITLGYQFLLKKNTMTNTNIFREHLQKAILNKDNNHKKWQHKRQWQCQKQSKILVSFETIIAILTIGNLNSWHSLWPELTIKSDTEQNPQFQRADTFCNEYDITILYFKKPAVNMIIHFWLTEHRVAANVRWRRRRTDVYSQYSDLMLTCSSVLGLLACTL